MLTTQSIEKALALCGKTMDDMLQIDFEYGYEIKHQQLIIGYDDSNIELCFSIEKFCYYLLSPEFIEKYVSKLVYPIYTNASIYYQAREFGNAIYEYQSGNKKPLLDLLDKIPG